MNRLSLAEVNALRRINKSLSRYPSDDDERFVDGLIYPTIRPNFHITPGEKVFTVGSCFARNMEKQLGEYDVPTLRYVPPEGDSLSQRGSTVFNEYNPGTIARRLLSAIHHDAEYEKGIIKEGTGYSDLYITGSQPCALEVVQKRRALMGDIYKELPGCDLLIITLGLIEAWYDRETGTYLNRAPASGAMRDPEGVGQRFEMHVLNVQDCLDLLVPAFESVFAAGLKRIMLTVSPVPLQFSFGGGDPVVANSYSKAVLRCVAEKLVTDFERVDYFPSYEMVTTYAGNPFITDNVHVKPEVVARVTRYMLDCYQKA
ncbi:GSCFA family protein [Rhodobacter viridis]|uniref:GSCFA family protein n=1 Tax=Rhodobacter viridis TaxID=1054202 RepID=A0A318TYK6_9RHOB|nr:GSCFA domain-containing protein [Rhodobacter viridis]PYF10041.1 GSCFA family protein [Rhodobacter viridis]